MAFSTVFAMALIMLLSLYTKQCARLSTGDNKIKISEILKMLSQDLISYVRANKDTHLIRVNVRFCL